MSQNSDGLLGYGVAAGIAVIVIIGISSAANQNQGVNQDSGDIPYVGEVSSADQVLKPSSQSELSPSFSEQTLNPTFAIEGQPLSDLSTIHRVALASSGGVLEVPVTINGLVRGNFTLDSGASVVVLSKEIFVELINKDGIKKNEYLGTEKYTIADGSVIEAPVFMIKKITVGDITVRDIKAAVSGTGGGLLLGQSFLRRFKKWHVDNETDELIIEF